MSFFADIIADSRRRITPIHRYDPVSNALPVELNSDQAFVPESAESAEPVQNKIIGNDGVSHKDTKITQPDTTLVAAASQSQTSTARVDAMTPGITATDAHVLLDAKPSASELVSASTTRRQTSPVVPTVQLKTAHGVQSNRMPSKSPSQISGEANATDQAKPDVAQLATKKINPVQEQPVAKPFTSLKTTLSEQQSRKQNEITQAQSDIAKSKLLPDPIIDQAEMQPEDAGSRVVMSTQPQQPGDQHVEASTVLAEIQAESTARAIQPVIPFGTVHVDDLIKNQPRVQIGQVNVVIEQPASPRRRASSIATSDDYASRNFLKSL